MARARAAGARRRSSPRGRPLARPVVHRLDGAPRGRRGGSHRTPPRARPLRVPTPRSRASVAYGRRMSTLAQLISVQDAQRIVLEHAKRLDPERVPNERAAGRVLAAPVAAGLDLPPFASPAVGGYAVRSADTAAAPVRLPVVAQIAAGTPAPRPLGAGEAMAISTGGAVPAGADAVVPLEDVEADDDAIEIAEPVTEAANVRARGGDVSAGDLVLDAGTRLGPAQVAALAAAGVPGVQGAKRPRGGHP